MWIEFHRGKLSMKLATAIMALTLVGACASPSRTAESSGACDGLVADKKARPVPPMDRPALLSPVVDPAFGTRIIRITDAGRGNVAKPMYSTIQAWNADESLLILWHRRKGHQLYDGRTYEHLSGLSLESPTDIEQLYWDPIDPDLFYYPSNYNAVPRLMRYRVSRQRNDLVRDFRKAPTSCPVDWGTLLSTGDDPMDMSWGPEKIIGLMCGKRKFLYSIAEDKVLVTRESRGPVAPAVTHDGTLAYTDGRVLNHDLETVRRLDLANPYEHASLGRGASGPLLAAVDYDGSPAGTLVAHDLKTGTKRPVIAESNGWPYPPSGTHVSGVARSGSPGWFAVSVVGKPSKPCLLCQELLLVNVDTGDVCRVAHHRSWAGNGDWGYWGEPHVVLSPSGTRLIFGSDWGGGPSVDTYVVELPGYRGAE